MGSLKLGVNLDHVATLRQARYIDNTINSEPDLINSVKQAIKDGKEPPRVSEYIGECIYKIATRLSTKPNFINYSYRDEMICDGIENCLQYINNFNPEKSQNAFAYITQIIYYAFLRRIQKEKKQTHIKNKIIENRQYETFTVNEGDETIYDVQGFDPDIMLPDEDVYVVKKKDKKEEESEGLETFMETDKNT